MAYNCRRLNMGDIIKETDASLFFINGDRKREREIKERESKRRRIFTYSLPCLRGCWANLTFEHLLHLITTAHSLLTCLLTGQMNHTFIIVILLSFTQPKPLLQKYFPESASFVVPQGNISIQLISVLPVAHPQNQKALIGCVFQVLLQEPQLTNIVTYHTCSHLI